MEIKKSLPIAKNIILVNKYSRRSISNKIETFFKILDENNTGFQNFRHSKGYKIPFRSQPSQSKISFQPIVSWEEEELVKLEVKEILKKGGIRKVQPSEGEFVSNYSL